MPIQLFFDTCIIFNYINPTEIFHKDAIKLIDVVNNPQNYKIKSRTKEFRGYVLDIVEDEFFQIIHYKINLVLQDIQDFFKRVRNISEIELKNRLNLLRKQDFQLSNLITVIIDNCNIESSSNLKEIYERINNIRMILRKKYFQLFQFKNIQYRNIAQKNKSFIL